MSDDLDTRLRTIIASTLDRNIDPEKVTGNNLIDDLGISSVDALEVLIRIESAFGIMIADEDLSQDLVNSFDKLSAYVRGKTVPA